MSDYPRTNEPEVYRGSFRFDRVVAVLRISTVGWSSFAYLLSFHHHWERYAPDRSIFVYAPPFGNHLTTQIGGLIVGVFVEFGIWHGRGRAFFYALVVCLGAMATTLLAHFSGTVVWVMFLSELITFVY